MILHKNLFSFVYFIKMCNLKVIVCLYTYISMFISDLFYYPDYIEIDGALIPYHSVSVIYRGGNELKPET